MREKIEKCSFEILKNVLLVIACDIIYLFISLSHASQIFFLTMMHVIFQRTKSTFHVFILGRSRDPLVWKDSTLIPWIEILCAYLHKLTLTLISPSIFNKCKKVFVRNSNKRYFEFYTFFSFIRISSIIHSYSVNNGKSSKREIVSIKQKWTLMLQLNTLVKIGPYK